MKNKFKRLIFLICGILSTSFCLNFSVGYCQTSEKNLAKKEEESENFNFIKSSKNAVDIVYDGTLLLYGGIALIVISISGMIFCFFPKKNNT